LADEFPGAAAALAVIAATGPLIVKMDRWSRFVTEQLKHLMRWRGYDLDIEYSEPERLQGD
jgi:hypothetical protein